MLSFWLLLFIMMLYSCKDVFKLLYINFILVKAEIDELTTLLSSK